MSARVCLSSGMLMRGCNHDSNTFQCFFHRKVFYLGLQLALNLEHISKVKHEHTVWDASISIYFAQSSKVSFFS